MRYKAFSGSEAQPYENVRQVRFLSKTDCETIATYSDFLLKSYGY